MKTPLRVILVSLALSALASVAHAGPGPQQWENQRRAAQFRQLKPGDKLNYVCSQCKTVSEVPITAKEQAMEMCKEGARVACPTCHMKAKVALKPGKTGDTAAAEPEVVYVNEKGEECGFFVKANNKK